ncbi:MAG: hypothetical protein AAFN79_19155 [Pseudomonadota bacterium]
MAQFIVTTLDDENDSGATTANPGGTGLSLREAIALANAQAGADEIVFAPGLSGTITLSNGEFGVNSEISINGDIDGDLAADVVIDADDASRHFQIDGPSGGDLTLAGLTMINGSSGLGGSITNSGDLTVVNSTFEDNASTSIGGAVYVATGGSAFLGNVAFIENSANSFGGAIDSEGSITVVNGTFVGNSSGAAGGAINNNENAEIFFSTFTNNTTGGEGGAVNNFEAGGLTLESSILHGNLVRGALNDLSTTGDSVSVGNIIGYELHTGSVSPEVEINIRGDVFASASGVIGEAQENGGPVRTVAINAAGPAYTAASSFTLTDENDLDRDGDTDELIQFAANGAARYGF